MSEPPKLPSTVCPRCGATNPPHIAQCWLCQRQETADPYAAPAELSATDVPAAGPPAAAQQRSESVYAALLLGAVFLAVIIGVGLGAQDPGLLVPYLIVIAPAFLATAARFMFGIARGEQTKPSALLVAFVSGLSFVLVLGLLAIASIVALFLWCIWALGGG